MEKDKIFFGEGGITSTSANHCANVAKEMYQYLQNELFLMKLYTTEVSLIDSSEKKLDVVRFIIWVLGFVAYRLLMRVDIPCGNTFPDMAITFILMLIAGKLFAKKESCL
jgi:hypothetical protein